MKIFFNINFGRKPPDCEELMIIFSFQVAAKELELRELLEREIAEAERDKLKVSFQISTMIIQFRVVLLVLIDTMPDISIW